MIPAVHANVAEAARVLVSLADGARAQLSHEAPRPAAAPAPPAPEAAATPSGAPLSRAPAAAGDESAASATAAESSAPALTTTSAAASAEGPQLSPPGEAVGAPAGAAPSMSAAAAVIGGEAVTGRAAVDAPVDASAAGTALPATALGGAPGSGGGQGTAASESLLGAASGIVSDDGEGAVSPSASLRSVPLSVDGFAEAAADAAARSHAHLHAHAPQESELELVPEAEAEAAPELAAAAAAGLPPDPAAAAAVDPYTGLPVPEPLEAPPAPQAEPGSAAAAMAQLRAQLWQTPLSAYAGTVDEAFAALVELVAEDPAMRAALAADDPQALVHRDALYFARRARAAALPDYVPSVEDVLRCRVRTTGILEETFDVDGVAFSIVDVGGQRSERRKWIHAFEGVSAIIFVVSLSEYDQTLAEDESTNRLAESLRLFEEIANHPLFRDSSLVLFFNKRDLFAEKIRRTDLRQRNPDPRAAAAQPFLFDDYTGGCNEAAALKYITSLFLSKRREPPWTAPQPAPIFWRATCALDSEDFHIILRAVKEAVFAKALASFGALSWR